MSTKTVLTVNLSQCARIRFLKCLDVVFSFEILLSFFKNIRVQIAGLRVSLTNVRRVRGVSV